jgi:ubiquinol-cytochrome c reductase cytochrome b subunit
MVWLLGLVIYLLMMATAFMGYVLPWGQMSYWGAQVITGFFSAIPVIGEPLRIFILGGYAPDQAALTRFFSLHYLLPFIISAVVILKIWALHIPGSSNPTGVDVKNEKDTLPFPPLLHGQGRLRHRCRADPLLAVVFFFPTASATRQLHRGQPAGDPGAHRARMVFLALLRDPARLHGGLHPAGQAVGRAGDVRLHPAAVLPDLAGPLADPLDQLSPGVQDLLLGAGRGHHLLGLCGVMPAEQPWIALRQIAAAYYFAHFLIILPLVSKFEKPLPLPQQHLGKRASW